MVIFLEAGDVKFHSGDEKSNYIELNNSLGVTWCAFLETLSESLSLTYCEETADCSDTDLWFQCEYGTEVKTTILQENHVIEFLS